MGGSDVELWLNPTHVYLKTVVAADDGTFSTTVTIPADTAAGAYSIVAIGIGPDDEALELAAAITVAAPSPPPTATLAPSTSSDAPPLVPALVLLLGIASSLLLTTTYLGRRLRR